MESLIGELLDMGRIETGTLPVVAAPTTVVGLLDRARNTFLSGGGRHPLQLDLPPDLPRVAVNERRIAQVLNNLIANAARHSPDAAPIQIAATRQEGFVEISVTDQGEGVSAEHLPHLFSKEGGRGDASRAGLGLAICKGLVEAHGGRIRAESDGVGSGTRFAFTVPVAADASDALPAGVAAGHPPTGQSGRGASVLVVDDDPHTTRYVREVLAEAGYTPFVTGNPDEVPELVAQLNPHLVLLDLMLPNTDGIEMMRGVPGLAERPVIFISAYGRDETIARALEAGACDYIVKPFSPTELTARVGAALRGRVGLGPFEVGELAIDFDRHRVTLAGQEVPLTPTEYELLSALSSSGDRVLTYGALQRRLWPGSEVSADRVRTFVKKLRAKLDDPAASPKYIVNVRGIGYRMATQED
ncbi:MAG: response regulator [Gammaproteobacteria bacterium]|nr:response regulator [Gammaproteobacteria bacterium]